MANNYLTSTLISKEAAALFKVFTSFIATGNRRYEGMFSETTYKPGDSINARLDNFFVGQRGDSVVAEDVVEASLPVIIKPLFSIPFAYTPTDLQRKIADFGDEILRPQVRRLIAMMNLSIIEDALTQVTYFTGDPTANMNSYASLDRINPVMDNLAMDSAYRRYGSMSPTQVQQLRSSTSVQNNFVQALNKEVTMDASLGRLADFDLFKDQGLGIFVAGTHASSGSVTVATGVSSGSTITLAGLTSGTTFVPGDIFSIASTYEFNPILRQRTTRPMQFNVQQNATVAGDGTVTLTIAPEIQFTGPRKNIVADGGDTQIPSGAVVTLVPTHTPNFFYTERALVTCMPPLAPMDCPESSVATDPDYGISIRVSKTADVLNNKNIMRLDAQLASRWITGQAVRGISATGPAGL